MPPKNPKKKKTSPEKLKKLRELNHLVSVGDATLRDFDLLGIGTVAELAKCDARELYEKLCELKGVDLDPCCEDVLRAAVAQAKNPNLPKGQKQWAFWSKKRKSKETPFHH